MTVYLYTYISISTSVSTHMSSQIYDTAVFYRQGLQKNSLLYISIYSMRTYRASSSSRKRLAASRSSRSPSMTTSSSVPGGPGVFTASSNRLSSSQFLLFCVTSSKAAATKAVRSKVCLGGTAGCRGGGDTLSVSGVYGVPLPETIWLV